MLACSGTKWLLLSNADVALSSICAAAPTDGIHSLSATYCCWSAAHQAQHRPTALTELVISGEHHLHALLAAAQADHLFCVEPEATGQPGPGTPPAADLTAAVATDEEAPVPRASASTSTLPSALPPHTYADEQWQRVLHTASMAWAYRSREQSRQRCRLSLFSRGRRHVPGWASADASACGTAAGDGSSGCTFGSLAQGLSKTLFMEGRQGYGVCLDLHPTAPGLTAAQLHWLLRDSGEYCCAVRGGQLYCERLVQPWSCPRPRPLLVQRDMSCVVAGGTKGLGLQYGCQLVQRGCRSLVLTSRSGLLTKDQLIELAHQGAGSSCRSISPGACHSGNEMDPYIQPFHPVWILVCRCRRVCGAPRCF